MFTISLNRNLWNNINYRTGQKSEEHELSSASSLSIDEFKHIDIFSDNKLTQQVENMRNNYSKDSSKNRNFDIFNNYEYIKLEQTVTKLNLKINRLKERNKFLEK